MCNCNLENTNFPYKEDLPDHSPKSISRSALMFTGQCLKKTTGLTAIMYCSLLKIIVPIIYWYADTLPNVALKYFD